MVVVSCLPLKGFPAHLSKLRSHLTSDLGSVPSVQSSLKQPPWSPLLPWTPTRITLMLELTCQRRQAVVVAYDGGEGGCAFRVSAKTLAAEPHTPMMPRAIKVVFIEEPPPLLRGDRWPVDPFTIFNVVVMVGVRAGPL